MQQILIVEDHPLVAEATRALFTAMAMGNTTISHDAADAIRQMNSQTNWFRIFLDIGVPGATGLSLVRQAHERGLAERTVIITASENSQWRRDIESMGFLGYILKTSSVDAFSLALGDVFKGNRFFERIENSVQPTHLTQRQTDILRLMHGGSATKDIARQLNISPGTVNNHISAILRALNANDRAHAVAIGMNLGYLRN
jgi:DNA-binding NarL/FixJ family response regulator